MSSKFFKYVKQFEAREPFLPAFHTTDVYSFRDICENSKLTAQQCPVFNENLLYFFYGIPSYKISSNIKNEKNIVDMPIALVMNSENFCHIKRCYPFDTGAYENGLFKNYLPLKSKREDYLLGNTIFEISKIVSAFYKTNLNYVKGKTEINRIQNVFDFEITGYFDLINPTERTDYDLRARTVEIQYDEDLKIDKDNILAVIIPDDLLSAEYIVDLIENKTADISISVIISPL